MKLKRTTSQLRSFIIVCSLFVGLLVGAFSPVYAAVATQTAKGSITVSPAIINLSLPVGQQDASSKITLINNYDKPVHLVAEWQSIDEATGRLIPSGPLNPALTQSLRISETDITIASQSNKQVEIAVHNNSGLAPGGHYAILVFTVVANGKEKLGLQSALSVTVFVVKRDGIRTGIELNSQTIGHSLFTLPSQGTLTMTNSGNVHVVPRAAVTIEHGKDVIAKAIVNEASSPLLPGKKATYKLKFTKLSNIYWPSRLQLRTVYRVDQSANTQERVSSFLYIPPFWPFAMLAIVIGLYFGVKKGWPLIKRLRSRLARVVQRRKSRTLPAPPNDEPTVSKIPVSSVDISPSHNVPVERKAAPKKPKNAATKTPKRGKSKTTSKKSK